MLSKKRIAFVALLMCGFVIAVGWMLLPPAQALTQNNGGLFYTEWSPPVLVPELSTSQHEYPGSLSKDGLSLYFTRLNPATKEDVYVAHRPDTESSWGAPVKLPDGINTNSIDRVPFVSSDGHWLYFASDRPGGVGSVDTYVSWRADVNDDFAWQTPVNLVELNTATVDGGGILFVDEESGITQLYLAMDSTMTGLQPDIYMSVLGPNGWGPPSPVAELNSPVPYADGFPALRRDGREVFITSNRPGTLGRTDVWVSRRASINAPWSIPENVTVLNSAQQNSFTVLSWDGMTMYLSTGEPGANDIYVTHREMVSAANACLRSPLYYLHNLQYLNSRIGNASVVIGGFNYNQPISIAHHFGVVRAVLQGNSFPGLPPSSPQERLNQEFLAAQISVALAGGPGSAAAYGILNGQLQCYGSMLTFQPITLSNGARLTRYSTMGDLFEQARLALYENRFDDMDALASVFDLLNGNDPSGYCHQ